MTIIKQQTIITTIVVLPPTIYAILVFKRAEGLVCVGTALMTQVMSTVVDDKNVELTIVDDKNVGLTIVDDKNVGVSLVCSVKDVVNSVTLSVVVTMKGL